MRALIVIALAALAGCSSSQSAVSPGSSTARSADLTAADDSRYRVEMERAGAAPVAIAAPAARIWELLPGVYAELGFEGQVMDAARRVYGLPEITVRRRLAGAQISRYLNCGTRAGMANADSYSIRISVRTQVQPDGDGASTIRTQVDAMGRDPARSDHWVNCGSTNALERRIETMLRGRTAMD